MSAVNPRFKAACIISYSQFGKRKSEYRKILIWKISSKQKQKNSQFFLWYYQFCHTLLTRFQWLEPFIFFKQIRIKRLRSPPISIPNHRKKKWKTFFDLFQTNFHHFSRFGLLLFFFLGNFFGFGIEIKLEKIIVIEGIVFRKQICRKGRFNLIGIQRLFPNVDLFRKENIRTIGKAFRVSEKQI